MLDYLSTLASDLTGAEPTAMALSQRGRAAALLLVLTCIGCSIGGASAGCSAAGATTPDNAGDCAALMAAYAAWNGSAWTSKSAWASGMSAGTSLCSWGSTIVCTSGRVTSLSVSGNSIAGTIPPELGSLTKLTVL